MLNAAERQCIRDTWRLVVPVQETAADLFYRRMFELKPEYRAFFSEDMDKQKRKLMSTLNFVVKALDWPLENWQEDVDETDDLFLIVLALGRRHRELYRIPDESYPVVGEALLWALDYALGEAFTPEAHAAWAQVYNLLSTTMLVGDGSASLGTTLPAKEWGEMG